MLRSLCELLASALTPGVAPTPTTPTPTPRAAHAAGGAVNVGDGGDSSSSSGFGRTARGVGEREAEGVAGVFDAQDCQDLATQIWAPQPWLERDMLARLVGKLGKAVPMLRGRKAGAFLDACEAEVGRRRAIESAAEIGGPMGGGDAAQPRTSAVQDRDPTKGEEAGALQRFFHSVNVGLQLRKSGGKFSVVTLLENSEVRRRR